MSWLADALFGRRVACWLETVGAVGCIASTFSIASYIIGRRLGRRRPRVLSFVTDAGPVTRLWFVGEVDRIMLCDPQTQATARAFGVPEHRLRQSDHRCRPGSGPN
jgi:hypothetical protein